MRESSYKRRALVEEFKRGLNRVRRRLAEAKSSPTTIM